MQQWSTRSWTPPQEGMCIYILIVSKFRVALPKHYLFQEWLESYESMCVTRDWNVDRKRSNNCILTDFEKLSYRSQSFAQRKFYSNIENIFW